MDVSNTPVLFIIFNRPDLTKVVLSVIKQVRPKFLFVAADGPRKHIDGEIELCRQTKELVEGMVDWDCELKTFYREENLGCKLAVSGAINWFFQEVDRGIIIEDDCCPDLSFFNFCTELLDRYAMDDRIMHISGNNFQVSQIGSASYYLSKIPHIWGWATWKRAWNNYDVTLSTFDENAPCNFFSDDEINCFWRSILTKVKRGDIDTWDYQWTYALLQNNAYALHPQQNLVRNIGFDDRASRTKNAMDFSANLKTYSVGPLQHMHDFEYFTYADIQFQQMYGWLEPNYVRRLSLRCILNMLVLKIKNKIAN